MATSQDRQFLQGPNRTRPTEAVVSARGTEVDRLAMHDDMHAADVIQAVTTSWPQPVMLLHPTLIAASVGSRPSRRDLRADQAAVWASATVPVDASQTRHPTHPPHG